MRTWILAAGVLIQVGAVGFGQLPDFYRKVDRLTWVVDDTAAVVQGWKRLGLAAIEEHGVVELSAGGRTLRLRAATARIGDVELDWTEPLDSDNPFRDFLKSHGPGVFSLVHRVSNREALESEVLRLQKLGVEVLWRGALSTEGGGVEIVYFDTASEGKYVLGLFYNPDSGEPPPVYGSHPPFDGDIVQFAFAIRDPEPVSRFWEKLGFPAIEVTHGTLRDRRYRGAPGRFDHRLGWQRHGSVVYEWCIPLQGPTAYEDHLDRHGEGFHHLAFQVEDLDAIAESWARSGYPVLQSGAWGEAGRSGSGRFAYLDTDSLGGISVELLWSYGR